MVFDFIPKFHQESLGQRLMNGYVSLSAHPSYPIAHITSFLLLHSRVLSIKARKQGNNKEIIIGQIHSP